MSLYFDPYEIGSMSTIEQIAKLYRAVDRFARDYENFLEQVNKKLSKYDESYHKDIEVLQLEINQKIDDFVRIMEEFKINVDMSEYALKDHTHDEYLTEHQDLSDYAKKSEIPTDYAAKDHTHDEYLTEHQDLSAYAKKSDIPTDYATKDHTHDEYLTQHQDLSDYAKKSDIPTDYAKEDHKHDEYLTEHQDLSGYALKDHKHDEYLTEHQDLSGYALKTQLPTKLSQLTNDSNFITLNDLPIYNGEVV